MTTFNLIDEPWVPVQAGGVVTELGLRDVLLRAHEIDDLAGLSPPATVALFRLLLALVQRIYRPMDDGRWEGLRDDGAFGPDVDRYLAEWRHRFDLFDDQRPFYQVAELPFEPYERPALLLTLEWGAGNPGHFSHAPDEHPFSPAEAARHLVTYQPFSPGGLMTHEAGRVPDKYSRAAPLNRGAVARVLGANLFETLLLNAINYDPPYTPSSTGSADAPAWEQEQVARPEERRPLGYLDWMTWQARRVRLHPIEEDGRVVVRRAIAMKGWQLPNRVYPNEYETMMAYRVNKNAKLQDAPFLVIGFDTGRALWRDSLVLLESAGGQQPQTLRQLASRDPEGPAIRPLSLSGIAGNKSMVTLWRQELLPLPVAYLRDNDLRAPLRDAVDVADQAGRAVWGAADALASWLVGPDQDQPGSRKPERKVITAMREELGVEGRFWPRLERPFIDYLLEQAEAGYDPAPVRSWAKTVSRAAREALSSVIDSLDPDTRALRAGVEASAVLDRSLAAIWRQKEVLHEPAHAG